MRRECLDHFLVFGEEHMRHLVHTYADFYNQLRPHQGMGNRPLGSPLPDPRTFPPNPSQVKCRTWLRGLLKHYYSEAA
ncbi:MAG: integrase [Planctomycetota bacterium]|nr:integrase [Planctomycetota bacterium]